MTEYTAPALLNKLRPYFDLPRVQYSTDFAQFVDVESDEHAEYRDGLIAIAASVGVIFFIWGMVLLILKCGGKMAGCAAGHEFDQVVEHIETDSYATPRHTREEHSFQSTIQTIEMSGPRFHDEDGADDDLFNTPGRNSTYHRQELSYYEASVQTVKHPSRRERIAQVLFLLTAILTILCAAPIVLLVFEPLKQTGDSFETQLLDTQAVEQDINNAIATARDALEIASTVWDANPSHYSDLCSFDGPDFNETLEASMSPEEMTFYEAQQQDAIAQLKRMVDILSVDVGETQRTLTKELSSTEDFHRYFERALEYGNTVHQEYETYLWFIPGLLIAVILSTMIAMSGVMLSWTRKSSQQFQSTLSYGVLPFLVVMSVVAIVISMGAAVSAAMADDSCNAGSGDGAPRDTVLSVLETFNISTATAPYSFVAAYTGGCSDENVDPTIDLANLEEKVEIAADDLWKTLTKLERSEKSSLVQACGTSLDDVNILLGDARELAGSLTAVRRAIDSVASTLKCDHIYPLYVQTIEGSLCTDAAPTIGWAFLLFFGMGISIMFMITLRASWRHEAEGDELYEENEIDENMYVDEYEEYLAFISRYKHEWEEYEGFEADERVGSRHMMSPNPMAPLTPVSDHETASGTDTDSLEVDEKGSNLAGEELFEDESFVQAEDEARRLSAGVAEQEPLSRNPLYINIQDRQMQAPVFDPLRAQSPASEASEDISFFSLSEMSTPTSQAARDAFVLPQPLLGSGSPEEAERDEVVIAKLESNIATAALREQDAMRRLATQVAGSKRQELSVMEKLAPPNLAKLNTQGGALVLATGGRSSEDNANDPVLSKALVAKIDEQKADDFLSPLSQTDDAYFTSQPGQGEETLPEVFEDITPLPNSYDNDETTEKDKPLSEKEDASDNEPRSSNISSPERKAILDSPLSDSNTSPDTEHASPDAEEIPKSLHEDVAPRTSEVSSETREIGSDSQCENTMTMFYSTDNKRELERQDPLLETTDSHESAIAYEQEAVYPISPIGSSTIDGDSTTGTQEHAHSSSPQEVNMPVSPSQQDQRDDDFEHQRKQDLENACMLPLPPTDSFPEENESIEEEESLSQLSSHSEQMQEKSLEEAHPLHHKQEETTDFEVLGSLQQQKQKPSDGPIQPGQKEELFEC